MESWRWLRSAVASQGGRRILPSHASPRQKIPSTPSAIAAIRDIRSRMRSSTRDRQTDTVVAPRRRLL